MEAVAVAVAVSSSSGSSCDSSGSCANGTGVSLTECTSVSITVCTRSQHGAEISAGDGMLRVVWVLCDPARRIEWRRRLEDIGGGGGFSCCDPLVSVAIMYERWEVVVIKCTLGNG